MRVNDGHEVLAKQRDMLRAALLHYLRNKDMQLDARAPKPEDPVFGNVPDQGPAINDDVDDDDDGFGYNEYEAAGLVSQHNPAAGISGRRLLAIKQCPPLQYVIEHAQQVHPPSQMAIRTCSLKPEFEDGWVLDLDYLGDEGDGLPYYHARVKPAPEEDTETSIHSPSPAPVLPAPSHPPAVIALQIPSAPSQPPTDPTPQASPASFHPAAEYDGELLDNICPAHLFRVPCQLNETCRRLKLCTVSRYPH
ncbi:hypothetical protein IFM61392_03273 [Aspergillus lentulus]|nr:hypothetical protein IFM61392_03273 [Aspergillus lentulus]